MGKTNAKKPKTKKEKKAKKIREPEYVKTLINTQMINYRVYYMTGAQKLMNFLLAFIVGGIVGYVFFGNLALDAENNPTFMTMILNVVVVTTAGSLAGHFFLPMRADQMRERRLKEVRSQFRDLLDSLVTSVNSGKNITNAFSDAAKDLKIQYSEDACILQELAVILTGIEHNINIEKLLLDFGSRTGIQDIINFGITFETCYRKGGNIKNVLTKTHELISNKMQMEEEIKTKLASTTNEQYIMLVLPVVIVAVIKLLSEDMAANYASPSGIVVTIFSIAIFIGAYLLSVRISKIEV